RAAGLRAETRGASRAEGPCGRRRRARRLGRARRGRRGDLRRASRSRGSSTARARLSAYLFDTDVLSAVMRRDPPLALVRRLAQLPPERQFTSAITLGELLYGAAGRGSEELVHRVRELVVFAQAILPFDEAAAEVYGPLRARL